MSSEVDRRLCRRCPLCGSDASELHLEKQALRIVRCSSCTMLFANPVDHSYLYGTFYQQHAAYYLSPPKLQSDYASLRFRRELRLFRNFCRAGAVLDVGCSTGAFLHQLQQRHPGQYRPLGIDVAGPALDYAEQQGIQVLRTPFLEHDFGPEQFDAITFWAVLEHLAEPQAFLTKAASLLRPGGHCFLLVPNMGSLAVRCLGKRYRYLMPEHLNYFTAATLRRFLRQQQNMRLLGLRSTHFNPAVIWQDLRRGGAEPVLEAERARLLERTTRWKQNPFLLPLHILYAGAERILGGLRLADNLGAVLVRKEMGNEKASPQS